MFFKMRQFTCLKSSSQNVLYHTKYTYRDMQILRFKIKAFSRQIKASGVYGTKFITYMEQYKSCKPESVSSTGRHGPNRNFWTLQL